MKWASTFKYLPIEYDDKLAELENRTQRVSFRNNLSGSNVRVLLSNRFAGNPLKIERMTIGVEEGGSVTSPVPVTRNGRASFVLNQDEAIFSDEIPLSVMAGERLAVSVYLRERQWVESVCTFSSERETHITWNQSGDATDGQVFAPAAAEEINAAVEGPWFCGFSAVQVYTEDTAKVIAAFGDSITHMSFVTNELMDRLYRAYPGRVSLINCGIGGNRLVHDATYCREFPAEGRIFGAAGVKRFERDVFGIEEPDAVLVLEGINDIMHPIQFEGAKEAVDAAALEKGYIHLAEIAHSHGARICGATITPCGSPEYPAEWMEAFEQTRSAVNAWLRSSHPFDALFDYDLGVRDEERPDYMREDCSIGDGLHPNETGAKRMVDQIALETGVLSELFE